jgi:hypothetical protein
MSPSTFQMLLASLVLTRLDYANSTLAGLPVQLVRRLQSVLNAAARLIYELRRCDLVTDALLTLHWLKLLNISSSSWRCWFIGSFTALLRVTSVHCCGSRTCQGGAPSGRRLPHNSSFLQFACRPSALVLLRSPAPRSGTVCLLILPLLTVFPPSDVA